VFTALCARTGHRAYHIRVELLAERLVFPRKTRGEAIAEVIEVYVRRIEAMVRAQPYQRFNFYDYWPRDEGLRRNREKAEKKAEIKGGSEIESERRQDPDRARS
jgi:predicted LPLAT superfamily acyltransferase